MEKQNGQEVLLYSACITTSKTETLLARLYTIGVTIEDLLAKHAPDALAIETLFFNTNQKTAMGVAQARGIIIYLAQVAGCQILEYGPQAIKVAVTGHGASDKTAVIAMIKRLVPTAPASALDDEYDAIAVGVTALAHQR